MAIGTNVIARAIQSDYLGDVSDNFISNVLNILRLIKAAPELQGKAPLAYFTVWAGGELEPSTALRLCAYVQDQCDGALSLIDQSGLAQEAKAGLSQTVKSLQVAFSISGMNSAVTQQFPQLDAAISSFAILESVSNLSGGPPDKTELEQLIRDVEEVSASFDDSDIDPVVRDTAKKHLHVLLALLRNADALGVDAAMVAYAELVIRLKRVDASASEVARSKVANIWPKVERWGGRIRIDQSGAELRSGSTRPRPSDGTSTS